MKKFIVLVLTLFLSISGVSGAFAAQTVDGKQSAPIAQAIDSKADQLPINPDIQAKLLKDGGTVSITDKAELKKIAIKEGLSKVPVKIEYEYKPIQSSIKPSVNISPMSTLSNFWVDSSDKGSGWYNATSDMFKEFYVDGPDTGFVISETTSRSSTYDGSFGASLSAIQAKVGFSINTAHTVTWTSTTPITAGQHIHFQLFTTFHKVLYLV